MPRHIACLTFDFDVWSGWTARGMTTPTPVSRGEFGLVGAGRILDLLAQHGIRSTWCVPGVIIDTHQDACERVVAAGHEIAHHGYSHVPPANLSPEKEEEEMVRACDSIERLTGRRPRGYRSPAWDLSPVTIELLLKHGFDYESSMMGNDHTPYFCRQGDRPGVDQPFVFGQETRLIELPISWTLDDYPHFEFVRTPSSVLPGLASAGDVLQNWLDDFLYMTRTADWGVLTYTCHPFVIGRGHRMLMLERLIEGLAGMGAVFLTMEQAADEFLARGSRPAGQAGAAQQVPPIT
jgi:peptidoglycan/xylan/chitin deacetylase (PgdA/CDA1 family)